LPQAYNFPGVYIEEVPSGVRTIVGVPTSIVAFVGRAKMGPTLEPTTIFSFDEFERQFGGLWPKSSLGYAVRDFYLNARGGQAVIVRVPVGNATTPDVAATIPLTSLELVARSPGSWGNVLRAKVDYVKLISADPAAAKLFNLTVSVIGKDAANKDVVITQEVFRNVSTDLANPRRIDTVLESVSALVRLGQPLTDSSPRPPATAIDPADTLSVGTPAQGGLDADGNLEDGDIAEGLESLTKVDASGQAETFNLLVIPPLAGPSEEDPGLSASLIDLAAGLCESSRAMLLIDPPSTWKTAKNAIDGLASIGSPTKAAALYFPRIRKPDATIGDGKTEVDFAPSGAVAGVFARTDAERGVWKAPAGLDAVLRGAPKLSVSLNDQENGLLNPKAINCLRVKTGPARVVWGARTRFGDDDRGSEWKYVPIRRLANFIEETLFRNTQWVVFEPNDEPLWASIRLNVGSFMHSLFRQGAFQGATPRDAYFVKCDKDTNPQADIDRGIVNIVVGFAPLKPAEFVVIKLQQIAGSIET
jgi:phage tail sheath protein FI